MKKDILSFIMNYVRPELIVLVPFLNGIGWLLKAALKEENPNKIQTWVKKQLKGTGNIPFWLIAAGTFLAAIYGLIVSSHTGWKYFVDAIVCIGVIQGTIVALISMGAYDTVKS